MDEAAERSAVDASRAGNKRGRVRFFHRLSLLLPDHWLKENSGLET